VRRRSLAALLLPLLLTSCGGRGAAVVAPAARIPASDSAPSWSPDGTRIAYAHSAGSEESADRSGIYVVSAQGGVPVQILAGAYSYPSWSPDGSKLVVSSHGLHTITASGDSLTTLTTMLGYGAKWSPDGRTLAYQVYDESQVYRLWLISSRGEGARCLNSMGRISWFEPEWTPDGASLVHTRMGYGLSHPQVFVMDSSGIYGDRLTNDAFEARYPACSPDGQWIAWGSWHGEVAELWLMRADGTGARKLTNGLWPVWSPDSRSIAYTSAERWDGAYRLYSLNVASGEVRTLTE